MIRGFLHLVTPQPELVRSRFRRIGIVNHLGEWHWHGKRIALLAVLLLGEAGGLYFAYLEDNWPAAVVASVLVFYVLMAIICKETPLFTETDVRRRRNIIARLWKDIRWPCYCQLRLRERMVWAGDRGLALDDDVDRVARHIVGMYYIAVPPDVIGYLGHEEIFDNAVDILASDASDQYREQLRRAVEDHYLRLVYTLDGTPAQYRRLRDGSSD